MLPREQGRVIATMFRDEVMPQGICAPYRVELDGPERRRVWVPTDGDTVSRVAARGCAPLGLLLGWPRLLGL